ncbi:MAG: hypothetical protein P0Y49_16245 [Candidatus Pedobacter colombiensis]|uniref:Uncharacterized protein n=1 Tax=Candidatus Pedobacter colombiensis TaxID=3121371 RepID=A0AAJ5W6Z8_9SPHI|nr:hypothetical protein [Pedobacter sp.]WEK18341.1 MAG: hypothetical protein P0Y49_16245 [Pedobacter sp.]
MYSIIFYLLMGFICPSHSTTASTNNSQVVTTNDIPDIPDGPGGEMGNNPPR